MEKTIKYLENGEYHYATVKDVGDLAKLKTDSKDDLVTAINELFVTGGDAPKKPEGYDKLVDNVADVIQKQEQVATTITNMQQTSQLSDAEMAHMKQVQEELHQEYLKAVEELNKAVEKAKADAAALDKKTNDMQGKIDETFADVNKEVSDVHKQLDAESTGLHKDLDDTKASLEATRKDLLNSTQEYGQIHSDVKELQDKFNRRVWSTDLDPVREQVSKNSTEVQQTKDELKRKADQSNLDLVTNSVENLSAQVKQNASGLEVAVKRDELGGDVSRLLGDKTNLLIGTRDFSGEDNWKNRDTVTIEPGYYKGLKSAAVQVLDGSIYQPYRVKADTAYTFSFFAREDEDNPKAKLAIKPINAKNINIDNEEQVVHITTEWQRFAVTFLADKECDVSIQVIQGPEASNNVLHLAGLKLQYGQNNTPWEPNEADVAENIEKNESRFNVFSDQITGLLKKQEQIGDTERQLDTRITETAEGLKQTSKDLQNANGKITEFKGQLESTANGLKTDYEKYTNEAVGQISDSSLNLIHNSAFSNQDNQFESWQNISAKATVREDSNNLHWVELTQSGQGTDNPIGVTSNYFIVKQGKVTVAVDVKLGDKANLDNQNILLLELYDESKKRVDFTDVSVSQLGLSMSVLNDHNVHRGLYRLGIDRKDVKYMTVKAILHRNGDLWLTNFSARLSSIDDGGYTPNPDDINHQILKMNTKIEEDAEHIALKANSVDVTRDIKGAVDGIQIGGTNLAAGTNQEYAMGYGIPNTVWQDGYAYLKLPTNTTGIEILPQDPHSFHYTLTKGITYTQTIWFETDATVKDLGAAQITWFTSAGHDGQPATLVNLGENKYKVYSTYMWPGKSDNSVRLFDTEYLNSAFDLSTGTYLKFGKLKLEEGNKSTSWSPAPEDTSAEIKSAKDAAIQVASDQINIHVNELTTSFDDKLNKRVNEVKTASEKFTSDGIEQTVKKITDVKNDVDGVSNKVDNLQVGGRNLLHDTSDQWRTLQGDTWLQKTTASTCWTSTADYHSGNTFTYAAKITNNSHQQAELEIWLCDTNKNLINGQTFHAPIPQGANAYDVSVTFPITAGTWYIRSWVIFTGGHAPNGDSVQVKEERLVEGNLAGAWTPNPDDVNQKIDSVKTETTASVKNLGDKVATEVDSITTQMHDNLANNVELVRKSDFEDGSKGSWTAQCIVSATNPAPPAELGQSGMKVLQTNTRDSFEDGIWYSVKPGEKFDVDFWCAPSSAFISNLGLVFVDKDKNNWSWRGVGTDQSGQWKHYAGTVTAPANAAFAKPWFQMEKPGDNTANTAWLAKPHIRRQNPQVAEKLGELHSKWEVANGQIQGKVTETQVNDILNGKGYATQSWAQTTFQMKKDSITLQAVRDNITNDIQKQVNGINNKIDTQTLDSADINNMRTQGHYFVKNLANSPISGWVYVDITGNNSDRLKQDVYQDSGYEHRSRRWFGNSWTEWTTDVNNKNVVSQINITPDQIKIASNKIVIDGDTDIHGVLRVSDVKLAGRNGFVDLSGDGINITKNNGAGINIANNGIQLTANTNGQNEIEGVITTAWNLNNKNQNGIGLIVTPEQDLGKPYGGDILTIGSMLPAGIVHAAMVFDATGITGGNKGFNWFAPHTLDGSGGVLRFPGAQDDLMLYAGNIPGSRQSQWNQPTMRLVNGENHGSAGLQIQWDDLVPFGRITSSMSYMSAVGTDGNDGLTVSWYSWPGWYGGRKVPSLISTSPDGSHRNGGFAFYPGGEVCFWQGDFRSNFRWSGLHNEN